jgi:ubiquinone/menaquinone biosynthesis C-methylase UbiE
MPNHERIYKENAETYEQLISRQQSLELHLDAIRPYDGLDVVDLGAGTGRLAALMAQRARSVVALDSSQAMLDVLAERLKAAAGGGRANWRTAVADHRSLPLAGRSADMIVAGWTLCYLANSGVADAKRNLGLMIAEMKRVLRPGGTIVIFETMGTGTEVPNPPGFLLPYYARLTDEYQFSHTWIRTDYEFDSLEQAAELAGFFFGEELAERVRTNGWSRLPECAGIWWLHV